jgi:spermidine/putrescine transport system substrate-binding protein
MTGGRWRGGIALVVAGSLGTVVGCKGKEGGAAGGAVAKITITPTNDARADARTFLAQLCPQPIGGELNFMVWEGYTDTLFAKPFEEQCGVKLNSTYMGTSDELVSKLRAGGSETIDLISPSSDAVTQIITVGLAAPLDLTRIPSYMDLMASFRTLSLAHRGDSVFGVPWAFGPNPLVYDTTVVKPAPTSWSILYDPKYRGKISMQDDISTLWMVAQLMGMDDPADRSHLYSLSDDDLNKVHARALALRPQIRKYWATAGDMTQLFKSHEIVMGEGWPLMVAQLQAEGFPAGQVIPKEGTTAWADHWVMTRGAKNLRAAYAWLEYTAQPFTQKLLADVTAYYVANPGAKHYMTADAAAQQRDIADYGTSVNFWQWGTKRDKYQEIWNQVKAGQ